MAVLWMTALLSLLWATEAQLNSYYCVDGRDPMAHLFEWKWSDVAAECNWLARAGYCAVQVSPPQEHAVYSSGPWWQRYQAVSYKLESRSGSLEEFQDMIETCNKEGVWIYVDALINHMTGGGSGFGSASSYWNAGGATAANYGGQNYTGVPYSELDFNPPGDGNGGTCTTGNMEIQNYQDVNQVRNCRLSGLRDLSLHKLYVRNMVVEYMNRMIDIGVAGFRVDACKHMWPNDLEAIYARLNDLPTEWFPPGTKPYIFQEVIDMGGEPIRGNDYIHLGRVTEFKYGLQLSDHIMNKEICWLHNFGEEWGFLNRFYSVVFVDNHDNQRGHGGAGDILTYKQPELYKMAQAFMLAWDYGHARVMSSYDFTNTDEGPPSDEDGNTEDVRCQYEGGSWVCEHRWRQIANMVNFHNIAIGAPVENWWDNGNNIIAFSRGNRGFIAINNELLPIERVFITGLPPGDYCNVILCDGNRPPCSGQSGCDVITVQSNGLADIVVPAITNSVVAIHV